MKKLLLLVLTSSVFLIGCSATVKVDAPMTLEQQYEEYLNLAVPESITIDAGVIKEGMPAFLTSAYFKYNAEADYFTTLANHNDFAELSEFNREIVETDCTAPNFPDDFSSWTADAVSLDGKVCFEGIYFPYIHYLVYDPETEQVGHFVSGMRD